ncbi:hypothetical protein BBO99_00000811, partial [Phytophthora kernoviae]
FIGGIEFEDERIPFEDVPKMSPALPFNQIPVLEVDGEVVSQSTAILRYAGILSGLYPMTDMLAAFRVDGVFTLIDEMYNCPEWRASTKEQDSVKLEKMREALATGVITTTLSSLEKLVAQYNAPYAIGADLTVADLAIYTLVLTQKSGKPGIPSTITDPYQNLQRVFNLVKTHPKVVEWNAAHE